MQVNDTNKGYILLAIAGLAILGGIITLSIWGSSASRGRATPTVSVDAIYTSVYETFTAQQATQKALTPPTDTPSPTLFPTLPIAVTQPLPTTLFGTPTSPSGGTLGCDNSAFVRDVTIPDGTIVLPGQKFVKTWLMQNTGTCTWNGTYSMAFVSGEAMSGTTTPLTITVPPGQQLEISVNLTAPTQTGDHKGIWRLTNGNGLFFGNSPWVLITVAEATATPTDTPTPTATP